MRTILMVVLFSLFSLFAIAQRRSQDPRLAAVLAMKDPVTLKDTLQNWQNSKIESELQLLLNYYTARQNAEKVTEVTELMKQRFPNGRAKFNELGEAIYNSRDPLENEKTFREMEKMYGSREGYNLDGSRYFVAISFLGKSKPQKVYEYLNKIQNPEYKTNAYSYAARESIAANDHKLGEKLIRKTFADLKGDTTHRGYDEFCRIFSELLYANGKYEEGFAYAKLVYDKKSKVTAVGYENLSTTYLNYLIKSKRLETAYPMMVEKMKIGAASPLIKESFKAAYVAANGSETGFDALALQINEELKAKVRTELEKKIINTTAFDFTLKDVNGKTVRLSDYKGKVVVLDFWATWCGPCKAAFPMMQAAVNKYKNDEDVAFLFIHTLERGGNTTKAAADYIKDMKYSFKLLFDLKDDYASKTNEAAQGFKVNAIPCKIVIDGKGNMLFKLIGNTAPGMDAFMLEMETMITIAKESKKADRLANNN